MAKPRRDATVQQAAQIDTALAYLRLSRDLLKKAGASRKCVERVRDAINSAEGAERHIHNALSRQAITL